MKNLSKELEIILDYSFKDPKLLRQSLIHKSFNSHDNNEKFKKRIRNNFRLQF